MTALMIIGGILLLLLLLLSVPVCFDLSFREEFGLTVRYLFLRFKVLPAAEKPEEPEKPEEEKPKKEKEEKKERESTSEKFKRILKRTGFWGFVESLFELIGIALSTVKNVICHFRLKKFDLYLCLGGAQDAAEAAILYGKLSAGVYAGCTALFQVIKCREKAMTVDLNYDAPENVVDFSATLSVRPILVLKEGFSLLIKGLPVLLRLLGICKPKTKKEG